MRVIIGRTFFYKKDSKIYERGKNYPVNKEMGKWITRKQLGTVIPEVVQKKGKRHLKDLKGPPKDKMINGTNVKTK